MAGYHTPELCNKDFHVFAENLTNIFKRYRDDKSKKFLFSESYSEAIAKINKCLTERTKAIPLFVEQCKKIYVIELSNKYCAFDWLTSYAHIYVIEKLKQLQNYLIHMQKNLITFRNQTPKIIYSDSDKEFYNIDPQKTIEIQDIPYPQFPPNYFGEEFTKEEINHILELSKTNKAYSDIMHQYVIIFNKRNGGIQGKQKFKEKYQLEQDTMLINIFGGRTKRRVFKKRIKKTYKKVG